jgi:cytoskeletal protein CcmA (bactofilin family)
MRSAASRALGFFCALALALTLASPAFAAHFRKGETFVVAEGETLDDDLYAIGATVVINGTVNGDLVAAARTVIIRGTVTGSVFACGRDVTVLGSVGRTIRAAAEEVTIKGPIGSDAVVAGKSVEVWGKGRIARDLVAAGKSISVADTVGDDALLFGESVRLDNGAAIQDNLDYSSDLPLVMASGASVKGNVRDRSGDWKTRENRRGRAVGRVIRWVRGLVGMFLFGLLLVLPFGGFFTRAVDTLARSVLPSAGVGILLVFVIPLLTLFMLLLGILAGGWWIAFYLFVFFLFAVVTGHVVGGLAVGRWVAGLLGGRGVPNAWLLLMGLTVLAIVKLIPVLGLLVSFIAMLLGLGALGIAVMRRNRAVPGSPAKV